MIVTRMWIWKRVSTWVGAVVMGSSALSAGPPSAESPAPAYSGDGRLVRPVDYREWVFVSSGLGMTYGPAKAQDRRDPRFDNVFVTRDAYREFMNSGKWPDRTMFILEVRKADEHVSINNGGRTQGDLVAIEAAVKDTGRYPNEGWAYFSFDGPNGLEKSAPALPAAASCYACHKAKTAVDHTFVQFYPTLFEVAKQKGTLKPTYDLSKKPGG